MISKSAVLRLLRELIIPRWPSLVLSFLLLAINRLSGLVLPFSTRYLVDDVITRGQHQKLVPLVLAIVGSTVIQGISAFVLAQVLTKMGHRLVFELRERLQRHIATLPLLYYETNKVGSLLSRIMSDVDGIQNLVGEGTIEFLGGITTTVAALVFLLMISPLMTAVVACFVIGFAYLAKYRLRTVLGIFRDRRKINAEVTGRLTESLGGIRVVKSYHAEARESQAFSIRLRRLLDSMLVQVNINSLMNLAAVLLMGILGALLWYIGARSVMNGTLSTGKLVTFVAFLGYLVTPVRETVTIGSQLTEAFTSLERITEVLSEIPENEDPLRTISIGPVQGNIVFEHVYFSYDAGKCVLHDISFRAAPGSVTALVGPSGAGKSTIIGLLAAFHKPDQGHVFLDDVDLSKVQLGTYRTQLGVVLQESFLFDGTVAENIAFSRPSATRDEILEACRIAHVDEFVERLEKKYETVVGERGVKLSGGQKQRVSIARAILADPRVLILDEATSSLDSESEEFIQEGLKFLMKNRTTVVIAHRLSTVRQADQILVLDQGRIVEQGTHEFLCRLERRYWNMYMRQRGMEENLFVAPGA